MPNSSQFRGRNGEMLTEGYKVSVTAGVSSGGLFYNVVTITNNVYLKLLRKYILNVITIRI